MKNIPKIAHFYWDSPTGISFLRALTVVSFHKMNPTWIIKIHKSTACFENITWNSREHQITLNKVDNYDLLDKLPIQWVEHDFEKYGFYNDVSEVHKSDYLRWILMCKEGGLWSDFDILYYRPITQLKIKKFFDSAVCVYPTGHHAIGFLMGPKGSKLWTQVHKDSRKRFDRSGYQSIGSDILNSYLPNVFKKSAHIPVETVYPLNINKPEDFWEKDVDLLSIKNSIGLHWYAGHKMSNHWDNLITRESYSSYENTVCSVIKYIMGS